MWADFPGVVKDDQHTVRYKCRDCLYKARIVKTITEPALIQKEIAARESRVQSQPSKVQSSEPETRNLEPVPTFTAPSLETMGEKPGSVKWLYAAAYEVRQKCEATRLRCKELLDAMNGLDYRDPLIIETGKLVNSAHGELRTLEVIATNVMARIESEVSRR
jgi:hypothetical protein